MLNLVGLRLAHLRLSRLAKPPLEHEFLVSLHLFRCADNRQGARINFLIVGDFDGSRFASAGLLGERIV